MEICLLKLLFVKEFDGADRAACLHGIFSVGNLGWVSHGLTCWTGGLDDGAHRDSVGKFSHQPRVRRSNKRVLLVVRTVLIHGASLIPGNTFSVDAAAPFTPSATVCKMS